MDTLVESKEEYGITAFKRNDMDWFRDSGKLVYGKFRFKVAVIEEDNSIVKVTRDTSYTMQ